MYEKLVSKILVVKIIASGRACFAAARSNSKTPPPEMPPVPLRSHRSNGARVREDPLKPEEPEGGGNAGATMALSPNL